MDIHVEGDEFAEDSKNSKLQTKFMFFPYWLMNIVIKTFKRWKKKHLVERVEVSMLHQVIRKNTILRFSFLF